MGWRCHLSLNRLTINNLLSSLSFIFFLTTLLTCFCQGLYATYEIYYIGMRKMKTKSKWNKLSEKLIDLLKIDNSDPIKIAEGDFESLKIAEEETHRVTIQSPFIIGKYVYFVSRAIESDSDFENCIYTYRLFRAPIESVKTIVVRRAKE